MISFNNKIQIIYTPGTFGNCLRWMLDRFSLDCAFKNIDSPWDKHSRVNTNWKYNPRFIRGHQIDNRPDSPDPLAKKIVISFTKKDLLFAERCGYYRTPGNEKENLRYSNITNKADVSFVKQTFGEVTSNKNVAKELTKIKFHDENNHNWWNNIFQYIENKKHYQFNVYALWQKEKLINELNSISKKFELNLQIDNTVIENVVNHIKNTYVVLTKDRAHTVLDAIKNNNNIDCDELDILEQAYVETTLEKEHDLLLFPYGTNWFNNTAQINEFINTYPSYLKHMNPRLPWYNKIKNPYYLTGKID